MVSGTLYGVGVGPGDPELMTLKAARLIRDADVIAYPRPDDGPSSSRAIAASLLGEQIEEEIVVPMRVARHPAAEVYDEAAKRLGSHLAIGRNVVVLCEGDPFFYGSFMYLFERMARRWPTQVVPGIASITAAAAAIPCPLAARDDTVCVLPATLPDEALREQIERSDAVAIIKLGRHLARVRALLRDMRLEQCTHYCERIGSPDERVVHLAARGEEAAPYFSMLLIYRGRDDAIVPFAQAVR